jgi:signal transduction histidine kinase
LNEPSSNKSKLPELPHPEEVFTRSEIFAIRAYVRLFNNKLLRVLVASVLSLFFSNAIFRIDAWIYPNHVYVFPSFVFPVFFICWTFAFYRVMRFLMKKHFIALDFAYRRFLRQRGENLEALIDLERRLQFARSAAAPEVIVRKSDMPIEEQRIAYRKLEDEHLRSRSDRVKSLEFESIVGRWYGLEIPQREIGMPPFP